MSMVLLARGIDVSPLDRVGQVSGLAGLQLRYAVLGLVLLAVVAITATARWARLSALTVRMVAAGAAGLFSGLVAGAVVVALRGTSWGLFGPVGDAGTLTAMARNLLETGWVPTTYPPGFIHALAGYAELTGSTPEHSLKVLQIVLTALYGPAVYLAWRLLLPPLWALGVGVVAALPVVETYKPYEPIALALLIPVLLLLLRHLRRSGGMSWRRLALAGVGFGLALGAIFELYSAWFVWSAPGVLAAALLVFPWRRGATRGLTLVAVTAVVFALIGHRHLLGLVEIHDSFPDRWFYYDAYVEPAYFAMGRAMPGVNVGQWPPPGELGGVGLFTVLLLAGLMAALTVAWRRTIVLALACIFAGAWIMRFLISSRMYAGNAVDFYPRTATELLYCLLLLTGFGIYYTVQRVRASTPAGWSALAVSSPVRVGVVAALLLLFASAGSAIGDRYMPRTDDSWGAAAFWSHISRQVDGKCPSYLATLGVSCLPGDMPFEEIMRRFTDGAPRPGELPHVLKPG
ncbi:MAG TPA: hypothetical protein VFV67_22100 [Actinophytocola sp.]|uniref:hypothetical protein n=1 Tax=Actinophytocola sp. TaxID=1872138 RepID=UPI002DB6080B|nr:hypothetical protein [Actinophytocola sp.]HEU5473345.1 hypothetical protein [Actinophytocola sp.]